MAVVSANTLFHFTNLDSLKDILENKFHPNYCAEDYKQDESNKPEYLIPMLCFCDLPLSQIGEHMGRYGHYGIGMTKQWGLVNNLNPVLYINKNVLINRKKDYLFTVYRGLITQQTERYREKKDVVEGWLKMENNIDYLLSFIKPIKGRKFNFNNMKFDNVEYDFYDEKEWRYVPDLEDDENKNIGIIEDYIPPEIILNKQRNLERHKIDFRIKDDIKYIILNEDKEILEFTKYIDEIYEDKETVDDITLLKTKIINAKSIKEDT